MTDPTEAVSGWIGPLIGIGIAAAALKYISGLNLTQEQKTEIGNLLSKAKSVDDGFLLRVYNRNISKAKRILNTSGFKIINVYPSSTGISYISFVEKYK